MKRILMVGFREVELEEVINWGKLIKSEELLWSEQDEEILKHLEALVKAKANPTL